MFQEFAVTVCVAIVVSVIVSVTLTPMLCAHLLSEHHSAEAGALSRLLERGFVAIQSSYEAMLVLALRFKPVTLSVLLASIAATGLLFVGIPKGFFPQQDTGMIAGITEAAADVSPAQMAALHRSVIDITAKDPSVANATGYIGPGGPTVTENNGRLFVLLKPRGERWLSADEVIRQLASKLAKLKGISAFMQATQDINLASRLSKTQYQFTLTNVNQDELNLWAGKLFEKLKTLPELADVATDEANAARQLKLQIDCDAASRLGIDPAAVDNTLYDAFGQRHVAQLFTALNTYYVILEVDPSFQLGPYALNRIYVRSASGSMVPLSQFTSIHYDTAPLAVNHQSQFPSVTLSCNLAPGAAVGHGGCGRREGEHRAADAGNHCNEFPGQRAGVPASTCKHADPDHGRDRRRPPNPRHALQKRDPSYHHSVHAALRGTRSTAWLVDVRLWTGRHRADRNHFADRHRADRHHFADRHRAEERHHVDRLRVGGGTRRRAYR
jgi:multidrug efflux pump subunit AcrB